MKPLERVFAEIYEKNIWGDPETRSGMGSRKESSYVRDTLAALREIVARYDVRSLADIPCGDFNWIGEFLLGSRVRYVGYDIVAKLVADNREKHPGIEFRQLNIVEGVPERADLILCKDLLNHLTYEEVRCALENMRRSGARYLLASNNFGCRNRQSAHRWFNSGWEVMAGRWPSFKIRRPRKRFSRYLDITAAPLNYTAPIWRSGYLGLWSLPDLESLSDPAPRRSLRALVKSMLRRDPTQDGRHFGPGRKSG
jgi:SAM-dependent methyltransferase